MITGSGSLPKTVAPDGWELRNGGLTLRALQGPTVPRDVILLRAASFGQFEPDSFDDQSLQLVVTEADGRLAAACRLRLHSDGVSLTNGYSGQFYHLDHLAPIGMPMVELGRLCTATGASQALALRLIWAGIADLTQHWGAKSIFGCASFPGADPRRHWTALCYLAAQYRDNQRKGAVAKVTEPYRVTLKPGEDGNLPTLPPLLRSYLSLGAWVGPDAVLDPELDTLHVLTVLEIARIPLARRRALAAFVAAAGGHQVDEAGHSA